MIGPVFVDTNILVCCSDLSDPAKQARADAWHTLLWQARSGRVSFQVLLELYVTLTRKLKPGLNPEEAREIVRDLAAWRPIPVDLGVIQRAWFLEQRHSLSWWDALIVAAAQASKCAVLLTEELPHGQAFGTVRVVNPFAAPDQTPAEILQTLAP